MTAEFSADLLGKGLPGRPSVWRKSPVFSLACAVHRGPWAVVIMAPLGLAMEPQLAVSDLGL